MAYHANHARPARRALGADAAPGDPKIRILQQQVNRFVPSRFTMKVAVDGVMSQPLASYATGVLFDRAKRALETYGASEPTTGFYHKAYNDALAHVASPLPWVAQNLDAVIEEVANFGNFLGLPPAEGSLIARLVSDWRVWVAGVGVGILVLGRRRKTRR